MYAQSCNAELVVEKGRDSRSITQGDPTVYTLLLTNTSSGANEYTIVTKYNSNSCESSNKKAGFSNVTLNAQVLDIDNVKKSAKNINRKSTNKIRLKSGESYKFYVEVSTADKVKDNVWSCTEVLAIGTKCNEKNAAKATLKTYLRNASEE